MRSRSVVVALSLLFSFGTLQAAQWRSYGPEGGAVGILAAAPSDARVLYFTSGSQLFRSRDFGSTWSTVSGPFNQIATLAIDPRDPQTVFVASSSGHLYKTRDGGATWTAIGATPSALTFVSSIAIDPRDGNIVYLSRDCGPYLELFFEAAGVFKSIDGGLTFAPATNGMQGFQYCTKALSFDPFNPDTIYAVAQYSDNGYARSDDGARTWTRAATTLPGKSVADPDDPQKRYGTAGRSFGPFLTSTDGGLTWFSQETTALETGTHLPHGSAEALTIDDRSGRLFLAGQDGVFRSGDGGRSVLALGGPAREVTRGLVFDEATGALVIGTDTGVHRSEAFPWNDWKRLPTGDSSLRMHDVAASRIDATTMYAVSSGNVHITHDHGLTWSVLGDPLPLTNLKAPTLASIAVDVADNVYVTGQADSESKVYKLAVGTSRWVELTPTLESHRMIADPGTPGVIYLIRGVTPTFIATRDGGATWNFHFTPTGDASSLAIDPRDGAVFYAGTPESLLKSYNGGHTWTALIPGMILDVQISPADPNAVYAIERESGTQSSRIHVSRDAGATWTSHVAMGEIVSMALDPRDPRTIVTSLVEGTVYRSSDEGARWETITGDLPTDSIRLAFSLDGRVLHAATTTRGMWELMESTRRRSVTPR